MNKDDIIRMAREFGAYPAAGVDGALLFWSESQVERFFQAAYAAGAIAEREACAKLCEDKAMRLETKAQEAIEAGEYGEVNAIRSTAWQIGVCAAEIRARGNT